MQEFMVRIAISDASAAKLQDLGAMLKVSLEDVLCAATHVGLTDWESIECHLIVSPGPFSNEQQPGLKDKQRFTATLDLDRVQADRVSETAEWFDTSLTDFLENCLQGGIAHAEQAMLKEQESMSADIPKPIGSGDGRPLSEAIDDDIPF